MPSQNRVALNLAAAFLSGAWSVRAMARRAAETLGRSERWLGALARNVVAAFAADAPRPALAAVASFIQTDAVFQSNCHAGEPLRRLFWVPDRMAPAAGAPETWHVPPLSSPGALAAWLGLDVAELDWFAGSHGRARRAAPGPLRHYTYRWLVSRRGKARLLEMPKARLKDIQRRILHDLLDHIPPHDAAHGFRAGRSIATYVAPHTGRRVVLHLDLCQFFPTIRAARVRSVFTAAGYPPAVAGLLVGLCTNAVPDDALRGRPAQARHARGTDDALLRYRHLPQGAPTSPALANLCAFRLDCRLDGLSRAAAARYSRYADDLVFSGDEALERGLRRFHVQVCRIVLEEGFEVNTYKSHFMRQGVRQQVAGIVLNAHANVPRDEFDRLKAMLTNCVRHGPAGQNRDGHADFQAHVAGRIAYVAMIHPRRGQRLRDLFARIAWRDASGPA